MAQSLAIIYEQIVTTATAPVLEPCSTTYKLPDAFNAALRGCMLAVGTCISTINPSFGDINFISQLQLNKIKTEYDVFKNNLSSGNFELSTEQEQNITKELYSKIKEEPITNIMNNVRKIKLLKNNNQVIT